MGENGGIMLLHLNMSHLHINVLTSEENVKYFVFKFSFDKSLMAENKLTNLKPDRDKILTQTIC